jgi:hypothetical protein
MWPMDPRRDYSWRQALFGQGSCPILITSNPLPGAGDRYVVLNSGYTFHEKEFAAYNYLLFPRLGDWAVMKIGENEAKWGPSVKEFPEESMVAGFFDEQWKRAVAVTR